MVLTKCNMKTRQLLLFLSTISTLAGCGQIGPLYLPNSVAPIYVPPEQKSVPQSKPKATPAQKPALETEPEI